MLAPAAGANVRNTGVAPAPHGLFPAATLSSALSDMGLPVPLAAAAGVSHIYRNGCYPRGLSPTAAPPSAFPGLRSAVARHDIGKKSASSWKASSPAIAFAPTPAERLS